MFRVSIFAVVVTALASFSVLHVESVECPSEPFVVDVQADEDVEDLRVAMGCTGKRAFEVTWHNVSIDKRIEVSDGNNLTVTGSSDTAVAEINARGTDGIFFVSNRSTLTLNQLVLRGGNATGAGGAIATDRSTVNVEGCSFVSNNASLSGGAIYAASSNLTLTGRNVFINNSANSTNGGALALSDLTSVYIDDIMASHNTAAEGGGVFNVISSSIYFNGEVNLTRNKAGGGGGAINGHKAVITFMAISRLDWNTASDGGAIHANLSSIYIHGPTVFEWNTASLDGGAINEEECTTNITSYTNFTSNNARSGGAFMSSSGSDVLFSGEVSFTNNSAQAGGGAMLITAPERLDLSDSRFTLNRAEFGGAISLTSTKEETRVFGECHFEENEATDGGALYLYTGAGTAAVKNSSFVKNYARISGGAIFHTGSMTLERCDFTSNEAGDEGLAVISIGLLETMNNVSFANNTLHCDTGEYRYMNVTAQNDSHARFEMECARCSTGSEIIVETAEVTDANRIPVCAALPEGTNETETGVTLEDMILLKGYYRISKTSVVVRECYQDDACVGGSDADSYCELGYTGPYCAVCSPNYAQGITYTCTKCSPASKIWAVALGVLIALATLLATSMLLSHLGRGTDEWAEETMAGRKRWARLSVNCQDLFIKVFPLTAIKIVVVVWQIVSQFAAIAGNVYPQEYEDFLSKLSPINFDIGLLSSYSCVMETNFYDRLLLATIAPIVVLGLLVCTYAIARIRNRGSELAVRRVQNKHLSAALFVAFFVYSSVSYTVFQTFVCDKLDDGEDYLRADYGLTCTTDVHKKYELYAKFMVAIYPIGIPAVFTYWLAKHHRDLVKPERDDMVQLQPGSDIWSAYKPSRFYYEVVECARRITLTGVAVFVLPNSPAQIAVVLLLAVVFLFISESMSPFTKSVDMGLYRWGNGIILASMYVALLLKVDVSDEESTTLSAFAGVLIAANVCMVLTVFVQSALLVKDWFVAKRRARLGLSGVPLAIPVFLLDGRSAGEEDEHCPWSPNNVGYGGPIKRASVVPGPECSPTRPAPFKKQSCFRSTSSTTKSTISSIDCTTRASSPSDSS